MANLAETSSFDAVYQLETGDPVLGGPGGIANAQAQALLNRTKWLKDNHAPLQDPAFTGNPTTPTPPQFDNDTSLASTAFVQRALGNVRAVSIISAAVVLAATDCGGAFSLNEGASITLPPFAAVIPGARLMFVNAGTTVKAITAQGADKIFGPSGAYMGGALTVVYLQPGEWAAFTASGAQWEVTEGTPLMKLGAGLFGSSLAGGGYQKLPSGLIFQWMQGNAGQNGAAWNNAFPIAFPNAPLCVQAMHLGADPSVNIITDSLGPATVSLRSNYSAGAVGVYIFAVGF